MIEIPLLRHLSLCLLLVAPLPIAAQGHAPYTMLLYQRDTQPADIFINEIQPTIATPYTYFNALSWTGGYTGLQMVGDRSTGFIFSLWDPPNSTSTTDISSDFHASGGEISRFGGEGTGLHYLNRQTGWKTGHWYRVVVRCWDAGDATRCAKWSEDEDEHLWTHHVTMAIKEPHYRLNHAGAFLEDWHGSGDHKRRVELRGMSFRDLTGNWSLLESALYAVSHSLTGPGAFANAFDSGANPGSFFMQTGGDTKPTMPDHLLISARKTREPPPIPEPAAPSTPLPVLIESTATNHQHNLTVSWKLDERTTPQFAYKLKVFQNKEVQGDPIAESDDVAAEARSATAKLRPNAKGPFYLKLTLFDIFDREVSTTLTLR